MHQRVTDRQTDRQTDDMRSQDRALHYNSVPRGKNFLTYLQIILTTGNAGD